jgi:hypothetical protein
VFVAMLDRADVERLKQLTRVGLDLHALRLLARRREGGDDAADDLPARRHARPLQVARQLGQHQAYGCRRGYGMAERDRCVVTSDQHAGGGTNQVVEGGIRFRRRTPMLQPVGEAVEAAQRRQAARDTGTVGRYGRVETRKPAESRTRTGCASEMRVARQRLIARGPEPEALRKLVDEQVVGLGPRTAQCPHRVRRADHAMGRTGGHAGQ